MTYTDTQMLESNLADTQMLDNANLPDIVNVGVLISASGDLAVHGHDINVAAALALNDFNKHLESIDANWQMNLIIEDTQTDPIIALEKIQSLNSKGVNLILGPETSAELKNIKSYADSGNILILSPSSTSPNLAIDDNIFRFVPDDTKQGKVIAKLLQYNDIKVVIPVYRADVWGEGLHESAKNSFQSYGGIVDEGIRYSPEVTTFSNESSLLSDRVEFYSQSYDIDEIAILLISFSEAIHFLNFASSYDNLHNVKWFGSDVSSNDDAITQDQTAVQFVQDTNFTSTQFSASKNEKHDYVRDHIISEIGSLSNNYAYSAYDSLWILGLAIQETQSLDTVKLKDAIYDVPSSFSGTLGQITLNESGDLASSDYELWSVVDEQWILIGHYHSASETIELFE